MKNKTSRSIYLAIITTFIMMIISLGGNCLSASAQTINPQVIMNGKPLTFEVPPIIENGRTLVPLRAIFEAMGANVSWDDATRTVTATKGGTTVILPIGSTSPSVNAKTWSLEVPAKIVNSRTLAPLRFVGEAFGGQVGWDDSTKTVDITTSPADKVTAVVVSGAEVNLRSGPATTYDKVEIVRSGVTLQVIGDRDGWYQVSRGARTAWVAGWLVTPGTNVDSIPNETGGLDPQTSPEGNDGAIILETDLNKYGDEDTAVEPGFIAISTRQVAEGYRLLMRTAETTEPVISESNEGKKIVYTYKGLKLKSERFEAYFYLDSSKNGRVDIEGLTIDDTTWVTIKMPYKYTYLTNSDAGGKNHTFLIPSQLKDIENIFLPNGNQVIMINSLANMTYQEEQTNNHLIIQLPGTYLGLAEKQYELDGNVASKITVTETEKDKSIRLDIELSTIETYYVNKNVNGKTISIILVPPRAKDQPAPVERGEITVVIDPGHGGNDTGAVSYTRNLYEKDVNLGIAQKVNALLKQAGIKVIMTRNDDTAVDLYQRSVIANDAAADIFVSIHCDAVANAQANGTGTFSYAPEDNPVLFAQAYQRSLLADLLQKGLADKLGRVNRGVRQANFSVLRETTIPAALVETAFISNPDEEKLLAEASFQQKAAQAISEAIQKYITLTL